MSVYKQSNKLTQQLRFLESRVQQLELEKQEQYESLQMEIELLLLIIEDMQDECERGVYSSALSSEVKKETHNPNGHFSRSLQLISRIISR